MSRPLLLLFAETTVPDFVPVVQVLTLLLGAVTAVLVIAYYAKQLFFSHPREGQETVTEKRLEQVQKQLEQQLKEFQLESREHRQKLVETGLELQRQQNFDRDYTHTAVHKMQTDVQVSFNRVALLEQKVQDNVMVSLGRLEGRLDHLDRGMGNLGKKISRLMGRLSQHEDSDKAGDEDAPGDRH